MNTNVTPLTLAAMPRRRPPTTLDGQAVAVVEAIRAPGGPVVSLVAAVKPPSGETRHVVVNLETFTFTERADALRRLGRELADRWPAVRLFVGGAGLPFGRVRRCLSDLEGLRIEQGQPYTVRVDAQDPVGLLGRAGTVVLPSRPITVATDGAYNPRTGVAAAGWVTDTGLGQASRCQWERIVEAETVAICRLMGALPFHDLEVLTDSRPALRIVQDALDGGPVPWRLQSVLRRALRGHGGAVTIRWVPGHAGHPLNEAADRLVRAVRREAEGRAAPGSARRVRMNVRDDLMPARATA